MLFQNIENLGGAHRFECLPKGEGSSLAKYKWKCPDVVGANAKSMLDTSNDL